MAKVSIIVPVYNVESYIAKCINSLLAQTLDDMEFIIVDDHTPDKSIDIAHQLISGHPREKQFVFIQTPTNGGVGPARNYALTFAKGEYIGFVDSDDWVEPAMFEQLYNEAKHYQADLCFCRAFQNYLDGRPSDIIKNPNVPSGSFTHESRAYFLANYISRFWTFIYRREFLTNNSLGFYSSGWSEDSYFLTCSLLTAKTIASVSGIYYHYLVRPQSLTTRIDGKRYLTRMNVYDDVLSFAHQRGIYKEFKQEIDYLYIKKAILSAAREYVGGVTHPERQLLTQIGAHLIEKVPDYKHNIYLRRHIAIYILLFLLLHCPATTIRIIKCFG